jgi:cell division protein FtsB
MNEPTITEQSEVRLHKNHKGLKVFAIILLALLAIGSMGYSVYAWQQNTSLTSDLSQKQNDNKKLNEENVALKSSASDTADEQDTPVLSDQELAHKAAQDFVDAQVLDTKYIATSPEVKGNFASSGVAPSSQPSHIVSGLLLKKVNGDWVVIHHGQNGPDQDTITRFAVPEEFRS